MADQSQTKIPVNVFTGFIGAGKTTVIMHLLKQLPHPEKVVWLKNEYGDVNIDKLLLKNTSVVPKEILNGCLCCVLVGRLHDALEQIIRENNPERIIIESSGTAWPGPIVREIKRIERLNVDSVVNIIDCINFSGYEDISYTAKMQTQFVDLVVLNKYPVDANTNQQVQLNLEQKLDDVYEVFQQTTKVKSIDGRVDIKLLIGLDSNSMHQLDNTEASQTDEGHKHDDEVQSFTLKFPIDKKFTTEQIDNLLDSLNTKQYLRVKGVVNLIDGSTQIINWVLGQGNWQRIENYQDETKILVMGKNISKESLEPILKKSSM